MKVIKIPRVRRCRYIGCHSMCIIPMHYCEKHKALEKEYLQSRKKWQARSKSKQHIYNTVTRFRNDVKTEQYLFYRSKEWQDLRLAILKRDYYLCRYCLLHKTITPAKTVDHTIPIEVEPKFKDNPKNLETICRKCHHLKTEWEKHYYFADGHHAAIPIRQEIQDFKKVDLLMRKD